MTSEAKIETSGVQQQFSQLQTGESFQVLEDINLEIKSNSFVSIVGTSGCGKSTLLKILAGLLFPTSGKAFLDGELIMGPDARKGMVFQQDAVFPWLSVRKNIEYGPRCRGIKRSERAQLAKRWAKLVGLEGFEDAFPKELSGGMRKRVDLARVYANDPEIMLMDEPFGALDAQTKDLMQEELLKLWDQERKTVVFVTHDLEEAVFLSDQVVVMSARPGRIKIIETVDFPRPRSPELRLTEEFLETRRKLWSYMHET